MLVRRPGTRAGLATPAEGLALDQLPYRHRVREPGPRVNDGVLRSRLPGDEGVAGEPFGVVYGAEPVGQAEVCGPLPEGTRPLRGAEERRDEHLPSSTSTAMSGASPPSSEMT